MSFKVNSKKGRYVISMAIRRRVNEVLALSAAVLLAANLYLYYGESYASFEEVTIDNKNDTIFDYVHPPRCRKPIEEAIR